MSEKTPQEKITEQLIERLKKVETRGGFEIDKKSFVIEKNIGGQPVTFTANVKAKFSEQNLVATTADEKALNVRWNMNGNCLSAQNILLDLVITEKVVIK